MIMKELRNFYLFRNLNDKQFERLQEISNIVEYKKGTILFFEGDEAKSLIILIDGILRVYKTDRKGNNVTLHHFFPVDVVAEIVNFEHMRYPASAEFETDGKALIINYKIFEKEFLKSPEISFAFIKSLSKKIKYLENIIATNMTMNSTARVAKFICEHSNEILKLKKNIIASYLNITPETLSRILKKFSDLNLIEKQKDSIIVLNKDGLETYYL